MKTYKYYTPENLAEFLLLSLPEKHYRNVIDICCGSWNLITAALRVYPELICTGVDVDKNVEVLKPANANFYCCDGREFAMNTTEKYDLILSNPPFGTLRQEERFFNSLEQSIFLLSLCNKRYESEMTQANLLLTHSGSVLLFIWPSTFIEGDSYRVVRQEIAKHYTINWIAKLPGDIFGQSGISTYAVVLTKERNSNSVTVCWEICHDTVEWQKKNGREISQNDICAGRWADFLLPLKKVSVPIVRGNISSKELKKIESDGDAKVLHCTGDCVSGGWKPVIRYMRKDLLKISGKKAKKNDIVICRIGRSAGYWCKNPYEDILISDCILAMPYDEKIFCRMQIMSDKGRLGIPIRGVATKYITAEDIKRIICE